MHSFDSRLLLGLANRVIFNRYNGLDLLQMLFGCLSGLKFVMLAGLLLERGCCHGHDHGVSVDYITLVCYQHFEHLGLRDLCSPSWQR